MASSTYDLIVQLVAQVTCQPVQRVTPTTRLREDLGLDGDDVDAFLQALVQKVGVNLAGFDFYRYFREEPHLLWSITQYFQARRRGEWKTHPITIAHVVDVVRGGRWTDSDESHAASPTSAA